MGRAGKSGGAWGRRDKGQGLRGWLSELVSQLKDRADIKGECTLLVAGSEKPEIQSWDVVGDHIRTAVIHRRDSLSQIARENAAKTGMSRNKIYTQALKIKKEIKSE